MLPPEPCQGNRSAKKISSCEWIRPQSCRLPVHFLAMSIVARYSFSEAVVGREDGFASRDLSELAVEALNGVGRVDDPSDLAGVLEIFVGHHQRCDLHMAVSREPRDEPLDGFKVPAHPVVVVLCEAL